MGKKVYAIREGFDFTTNERIENIIVNTWAECLRYVKGVKGAKYKSFEDINDAKKFLDEGSKLLKKDRDEYPKDCLHIYVDGSYSVSTEKYSYGLVAVRDNVIEYIESSAAKDNTKSNIRQIAGELEAAIKGVEYAISKKDKKVVIFHDYEGIAHHATGFWERREESSINYYNKMNELINSGIEVVFVKVDSHTGDLFNEIADEKCKQELSIISDRVVDKWLDKNELYVTNNKIKRDILDIAKGKEGKIIVVGNSEEDVAISLDSLINEDINDNKDESIKVIEELNQIIKKISLENQLDVFKYAEYLYNKQK